MSNCNIKSNRAAKFISCVNALGMLAAAIFYTYLFVWEGLITFSGARVNVIYAVDMLLDFRYISTASAYKTLVGVVFSIWFFVLTGIMIRHCVSMVGYTKNTFLTKADGESTSSDWSLYLLDTFGRLFCGVVIYIVVFRMFETFSLSQNTVTGLLLGLGLLVLFRILHMIAKKQNCFAALYEHFVSTGMFLAGMALLLNSICTVTANDLLSAFQIFNFSGDLDNTRIVLWIFNAMVRTVMILVIQILVLKLASDSVAYLNQRAVSANGTKTILAWAVVLAALSAVVSVYAYHDLWGGLREYIPLVASAALLFCVQYLPDSSRLFEEEKGQ